MAVEDALDRASFLDDFGQDYTVSGSTFTGIFDNEYVSVNLDNFGVSTQETVLIVRTADVSGFSVSDEYELITGGVTYKVMDAEPDGTGMTRLILEKQ